MAIDWQYQTDCYNRRNKTNYKTSRSLLKTLYANLGSCSKVACELLVSGNSVHTKMKADKIQLNPKGWSGMPRCEKAIRKIKPPRIKNMTSKEVATEIGFSECYARMTMERIGIKFKKRWVWKKKREGVNVGCDNR